MTVFRSNSPFQRGTVILAVAVAPLLFGRGIPAAEKAPPDGISAGRWILIPSITISSGVDTNVFLRSEEDDPGPDRQRVTRLEAAGEALLPFRNSTLRFSLDASRKDYSRTQLQRPWEFQYAGALDLAFSSGDKVTLEARRTTGSADTVLFDPGGATVYRGEAFKYNTFGLALNRRFLGRRGWEASVVREDLNFDQGTVASFFDYRGWQGDALYREPLGSRTWATVSTSVRRLDQFLANDPDSTGIPFRVQRSAIVWVGAEGAVRSGEFWRLRIGRADYATRRAVATTERLWAVDGQASFPVGAGTHLILSLSRSAYPSTFFDNEVYRSDSASMRMERTASSGLEIGAGASLGRGGWPEPVPQFQEPGLTVVRRDRLARVDGYVTFPFSRRVGVRLTVLYQYRSSSYRAADYDDVAVLGGMAFGWY